MKEKNDVKVKKIEGGEKRKSERGRERERKKEKINEPKLKFTITDYNYYDLARHVPKKPKNKKIKKRRFFSP